MSECFIHLSGKRQSSTTISNAACGAIKKAASKYLNVLKQVGMVE